MTAYRNLICIMCLCAIWTIAPGCHEEDPPGDILAENLGSDSLILLPGSFSEDSYKQSGIPNGTAEIIELGEVIETPQPVEQDQAPATPEQGSKWERIFHKAMESAPAPDTDGPAEEAPDGEEEPER